LSNCGRGMRGFYLHVVIKTDCAEKFYTKVFLIIRIYTVMAFLTYTSY